MEKEEKLEDNVNRAVKRTRQDDPVAEFDRVDSHDSEPSSPESKRIRLDSDESALSSPEAKRFHYDLFNILDDSDNVIERDSTIQGLDSVIKSFEDEIQTQNLTFAPSQEPTVLDLTSDSGEPAQNELGYLLEASDDELGLPPNFNDSSAEELNVESLAELTATSSGEAFEFGGEAMPFENELPSYDSFEFGIDSDVHSNHENEGEFVTVGGLFDYPEDNCESSEVLWRPESLPAI